MLGAVGSLFIAASAAPQTALSQTSADCFACAAPSAVERPAARNPHVVAAAFAHAAPSSSESIPRRVNGALGGAFIGALAGVVLGAMIGGAVVECVDGPCIGALGGAVVGGGIGIVVGAVVGYLVTDEEAQQAR
jgi:hypothetical protein